ncbi:hypothetical protein TRIHO_03850 [Tritonibacter horizontis]|uniref:Uncharacterized protein n=1 Tax=Tritonibacter horizontis TaxID=1768241 RepID=A0A132C4X8_9RHOB|nr:hypothetical protein TRIHO_03850 [Tritonibacter horizontis]
MSGMLCVSDRPNAGRSHMQQVPGMTPVPCTWWGQKHTAPEEALVSYKFMFLLRLWRTWVRNAAEL